MALGSTRFGKAKHIVRPQCVPAQARNRRQRLLAHWAAGFIIDRCELADIEEYQGDRKARLQSSSRAEFTYPISPKVMTQAPALPHINHPQQYASFPAFHHAS
jgi:hypothetical protein